MAQELIKIQQKKRPPLPEYVEYCVFSDEWNDFSNEIQHIFALSSPEQKKALQEFFDDIFDRTFDLFTLDKEAAARFGLDTEKTAQFVKDIIGKFILVFADYFPEGPKLVKQFGIDENTYLPTNKLFRVMQRYLTDKLEEKLITLGRMNISKERMEMRHLFAKGVLDIVVSPDTKAKLQLNNTLLYLLSNIDGYNNELLKELYENGQWLGTEGIEYDGKKYEPNIKNWLKDYVAFAKGDISTVTLPQYLEFSPNAKKLRESDRHILRDLLETYRILKSFPESLSKLSPDQWMIIPYMEDERPLSSAHALPQQPVVSEQLPQQPQIPEAQITFPFHPVVKTIVEKTGALFNDPERAKRFETIILTRVKGIRNALETKEKLTAPFEQGGAGLSVQNADAALGAAQSAAELFAQGTLNLDGAQMPRTGEPDKNALDALMKETTANRAALFGRPRAAAKPTGAPHEPPPAMMIKEVGGVPMIVEKNEKTKDVIPFIQKEKQDKHILQNLSSLQPRPVSSPVSSNISSNIPVSSTAGHSIPVSVRNTPVSPPLSAVSRGKQDIKQHAKLTDAVEELRAMTVKDFRRLSAQPADAAKRIAEKIQELEKDSTTRKVAGMDAWRESEANQLYLEMGVESFGKGLPMEKVIEERNAAGTPTLTSQEFDALLELNEQIRI